MRRTKPSIKPFIIRAIVFVVGVLMLLYLIASFGYPPLNCVIYGMIPLCCASGIIFAETIYACHSKKRRIKKNRMIICLMIEGITILSCILFSLLLYNTVNAGTARFALIISSKISKYMLASACLTVLFSVLSRKCSLTLGTALSIIASIAVPIAGFICITGRFGLALYPSAAIGFIGVAQPPAFLLPILEIYKQSKEKMKRRANHDDYEFNDNSAEQLPAVQQNRENNAFIAKNSSKIDSTTAMLRLILRIALPVFIIGAIIFQVFAQSIISTKEVESAALSYSVKVSSYNAWINTYNQAMGLNNAARSMGLSGLTTKDLAEPLLKINELEGEIKKLESILQPAYDKYNQNHNIAIILIIVAGIDVLALLLIRVILRKNIPEPQEQGCND